MNIINYSFAVRLVTQIPNKLLLYLKEESGPTPVYFYLFIISTIYLTPYQLFLSFRLSFLRTGHWPIDTDRFRSEKLTTFKKPEILLTWRKNEQTSTWIRKLKMGNARSKKGGKEQGLVKRCIVRRRCELVKPLRNWK